MKNYFYEKSRRHFKLASMAKRESLINKTESYYKIDWLGRKDKKTEDELWDEHGLVPEEWLDLDDWVGQKLRHSNS